MKIYKIRKDKLKWKEMPQIQYKWKLPVLVNEDYEVIAGNSLKDCLEDDVFIIIANMDILSSDNIFKVENAIVLENSIVRYGRLDSVIRKYFKELRKPEIEQLTLFEEPKTTECISEENYIPPNESINYSHGIKKDIEDYQLYLFEEEVQKDKDNEIEIDMEILKELL